MAAEEGICGGTYLKSKAESRLLRTLFASAVKTLRTLFKYSPLLIVTLKASKGASILLVLVLVLARLMLSGDSSGFYLCS
jgi:hypothetical protein